MKIKKLSNYGFSHVEMFIVLVVVAAVSFIGYQVYTKSTAHAGSQLLGSISTLHDGTFNITASCKTLAPSTNATTYMFTAKASETNPNISYGFDGGASSFFISTQRGAKNVLTNGYTKTSPYPYSTNPDIKVNYNNPTVVLAGTADSISIPKTDWGAYGKVSTKNVVVDTKISPVIYFGTSYSNAFAKPIIRDELSWLNQSGTPVSNIPTCDTPPTPPVKNITPSAPQNVKATSAASSIDVTWVPPVSSGGSKTLKYTVVAKYKNEIISSCTTIGTACNINNLKPLVEYQIVAIASNEVGSSSAIFPQTVKPYIQDLVYSKGNSLMLNGNIYAFEGINAPWLLSDPSTNMGCYAQTYNKDAVDQLFSKLKRGTMVRINAYQDTSISPQSSKANLINNWTSVDTVFKEAHTYGIYLIPVLADNWSSCDGYSYTDNPTIYKEFANYAPKNKVAKTVSWYQGGYNKSFGDNAVIRDSYTLWMKKLVTHLNNTKNTDGVSEINSVGIWELMNEAMSIQDVTKNTDYSATNCGVNGVKPGSKGDGAEALAGFFVNESNQLKGLDPIHLISMGTSDHTPQCGLYGTGWQNIVSLPNIDIASYHDYSDSTNPSSEVNSRINYSKSISKPFIVGEIGLSDADSQVINTVKINDNKLLITNKKPVISASNLDQEYYDSAIKKNSTSPPDEICYWSSANINTNSLIAAKQSRFNILQTRINTEKADGVSGFLLWAWAPTIGIAKNSTKAVLTNNATCPTLIVNPDDPLMSNLKQLN
ncbi:MAG: fibronectin type III domain-containing protein [bacterium]